MGNLRRVVSGLCFVCMLSGCLMVVWTTLGANDETNQCVDAMQGNYQQQQAACQFPTSIAFGRVASQAR